MKHNAVFSLMIVVGLSLFSIHGLTAGDKTSSGFLADYLSQLEDVQKQILDLEQAVPQEKYTWRPSTEVRSVSEVYLHIAFGNYLFYKLVGYEPPADIQFDMDLKKWDTSTTDKNKIVEVIKKSFEHARSQAMQITDADLEKSIEFFGQKKSLRSLMITSLNHLHEHLGQSIAYARMNGVVPPWTAAEQAKEKAENEKKKEN